MKPRLNTLTLLLLLAVFLLAGTFILRTAAAQQSGDQTDCSSTKKPSESRQTPAAPATQSITTSNSNLAPSAQASQPAPSSPPTAGTPGAPKTAAKPQTAPAKGSGMVWVNTDSGIYHKPGSRYYGKTKQGKYMTEADAIKAGYRAAGRN